MSDPDDRNSIRYRKRPVVIEAQQHDGSRESADRLTRWINITGIKCSAHFGYIGNDVDLYIDTLEGRMAVGPKDWVIRGVQGEFYPCKSDIFAATYEPAGEQP